MARLPCSRGETIYGHQAQIVQVEPTALEELEEFPGGKAADFPKYSGEGLPGILCQGVSLVKETAG